MRTTAAHGLAVAVSSQLGSAIALLVMQVVKTDALWRSPQLASAKRSSSSLGADRAADRCAELIVQLFSDFHGETCRAGARERVRASLRLSLGSRSNRDGLSLLHQVAAHVIQM